MNSLFTTKDNLWETHPEVAELLITSEDGYKYSKGSNFKTKWKCPDCDHINQSQINRLVNNTKCNKCSDKLSLGEKIVYHLLDYKDIHFKHEVSFKWSQKKRYDFYIPSFNMIIEVHGIQHYEQTNRRGARTLQEEQENDELKKRIALENGIVNYITIDARKSDSEWIINNLLNSSLVNCLEVNSLDFTLFEFKPNLITLKAWNLWSEGCGIMSISEQLKISKKATRGYLTLGKSLGKSDYESKNRYDRIKKSVLKLDYTGEIIERFESGLDAKGGYSQKSLQVTRYPFDTIGRTDNYIWVYESEYNENSNMLKEKINKLNSESSIYQLNMNLELVEIHRDTVSASERTGYDYFGIRSSVDNTSKTHKGYIWLTNKKYKDFQDNTITKDNLNKKNYKTKKIVKLDLKYNLLESFISASEASRNPNSPSQTSISKCCRQERKTSGGFIWMFLDEYEKSIKK